MVGGDKLLERAGLRRLAPVWRGDRSDLITVGGDAPRKDSNWKDFTRYITEKDKKSIIAHVVEISVNVVMGSHIYFFCGHYFLQRNGGPISLRVTASLASLIMKILGQDVVEVVRKRRD